MIKEIIMFTVICDNCGKDANNGNEVVAWCDKDTAIELASDSGWIDLDNPDKNYCSECWNYDANDNLIIKQFSIVGLAC